MLSGYQVSFVALTHQSLPSPSATSLLAEGRHASLFSPLPPVLAPSFSCVSCAPVPSPSLRFTPAIPPVSLLLFVHLSFSSSHPSHLSLLPPSLCASVPFSSSHPCQKFLLPISLCASFTSSSHPSHLSFLTPFLVHRSLFSLSPKPPLLPYSLLHLCISPFSSSHSCHYHYSHYSPSFLTPRSHPSPIPRFTPWLCRPSTITADAQHNRFGGMFSEYMPRDPTFW